MTLTAEQVGALLRPVKPHRVMQAQGQSHLPAYDVVAHLNRMFGFGGWDKEIKAIDLVEERNDVPGKNGWYVTYRCLMRLTIKDEHGQVVAVREDGACGSAQNQPSLGDAHDLAYKNAISYAVKRCAKDWGDQFGLSLYNKGSVGALVGTTLVGLNGSGPAAGVDLEAFAPVPLSLGTDERHVDPESGEITGGGSEGPRAQEGSAPTVAAVSPSPPASAAPKPTKVVGGVTPAQNRMMQALFSGKGITSDDAKRQFAAAATGRDVASLTSLSPAEASKVIDALKAAPASPDDEGRPFE